jgi:hypothetical protein
VEIVIIFLVVGASGFVFAALVMMGRLYFKPWKRRRYEKAHHHRKKTGSSRLTY